MNNWHKIWNERALQSEGNLSLDTLIRLDGFDAGAGYVSLQAWREATSRVAKFIRLQDGESIFEVGCGAGAFLGALAERFKVSGGGLDYSDSLICVARLALPNMTFECGEARNLEPLPQYDHVLSHSMFHYFDHEYAEEVLRRMLAKARKTVAILEVPDAATRQDAERLRRDKLTPAEYAKKYDGLTHTYYQREWFEAQAQRLDATCEFVENQIPGYEQGKFRFGLVIRIL